MQSEVMIFVKFRENISNGLQNVHITETAVFNVQRVIAQKACEQE